MKSQTLDLSALSLSLLAPLCARADEPIKVAPLPDPTQLLLALPPSALAKSLDPIIIEPKKEFTYSMPSGPIPQTNDAINWPKSSSPLPLYNFRLAPGDQLQLQPRLVPIPQTPPILKDLPQIGQLFVTPKRQLAPLPQTPPILKDLPQIGQLFVAPNSQLHGSLSYSFVPTPAAPTNNATANPK